MFDRCYYLALVCAYLFSTKDLQINIVSFFFLLFLFYVGDNVEFKYGVGYSHCIACFIFLFCFVESIG